MSQIIVFLQSFNDHRKCKLIGLAKNLSTLTEQTSLFITVFTKAYQTLSLTIASSLFLYPTSPSFILILSSDLHKNFKEILLFFIF